MADEKRKRLILDPSRPPFTSTMIHTPYKDSRKLSITYSSGLIPPPELMSTLAVFYDEIWLPSIFGMDAFLEGISNNIKYYSLLDIPKFVIKSRSQDRQALEYEAQTVRKIKDLYDQKMNNWKLLCDNGIIQVISPTFEDISKEKKAIISTSMKLHEEILSISDNHPIESMILAHHILLKSKPAPELFISDPSDTSTPRLAVSLVNSLFQYLVPCLKTLNAEQILDIRDSIKDTKKGLAHYINSMTDNVNQRMNDDNISQMEAAQRTFERKILPLYEDYKRQLAVKKAGYWTNVLSASGDFLKVDVAPSTPKFYGEIFKWIGVVLNLTAKDEETLLTTQNQAFHCLATLESKGLNYSKRLP